MGRFAAAAAHQGSVALPRAELGEACMLRASGGRKDERACEAEASRIAGSGKAGRCGAEACLPRGAQLSSFLALWTWKKAWFRQPEALLSKRARCLSAAHDFGQPLQLFPYSVPFLGGKSGGATSPDQLHGSACSLCILLQECILSNYISPHATRETVSPTPRTTAMTSTCRVPL